MPPLAFAPILPLRHLQLRIRLALGLGDDFLYGGGGLLCVDS